MKILILVAAASLFYAPLYAHPCPPKAKPRTFVAAKYMPCRPETLRLEKETIHVIEPGRQEISKKSHVGPWIALAGALVAGAILAKDDEHVIRVSTRGYCPPPPCKDKGHKKGC